MSDFDTLAKLWSAVSELQERGNYNLLSRDEIREYAEAGMITPFVGEKVSHESAEIWDSGGISFNQYNQLVLPAMGVKATQKVISYGLGHFGYDIRIGSEFQVFSPNPEKAAYIDPKNFDSAILRPVTGDCFIPPNSYALGVSVEKFDIPDDIMCVVLGKSTYARCFSGDTRVALVDGTAPTLEEMVERYSNGEMFWGYSINTEGRVIVTLLEAPRYIGRDSLLQITLDNGETINCTPDHEFVIRDGSLMAASSLRVGQSLMPLYRGEARGYEVVYQPNDGGISPTHRLADNWNIRHNLYEALPNTHRHHIDHDKRNNAPWNITRVEASAHTRYHNDLYYGEAFDSEVHGEAIKAALRELYQDEQRLQAFRAQQTEKAQRFWTEPQYQQLRDRLRQQRLDSWTAERRAAHSEKLRQYYEDTENRITHGIIMKGTWDRDDGTRREQQREIMRNINLRTEITEEAVREALQKNGSIRGAAKALNCDRSVFRRFPHLIAAFKQTKNHKIVEVRELPGEHDVYCLTVPEAGNFALESGVFVKNCGIIVNVTPGEPGWTGHWTIEISNSTPLPARIYANEGIAQVLFFRGPKPSINYAQVNGKYMHQSNKVVLARV